MSQEKIDLIKGILARLSALPEMECRCCGFIIGAAPDMHCLSCSIDAITAYVRKHVEFWEKDERWKKAPS